MRSINRLKTWKVGVWPVFWGEAERGEKREDAGRREREEDSEMADWGISPFGIPRLATAFIFKYFVFKLLAIFYLARILIPLFAIKPPQYFFICQQSLGSFRSFQNYTRAQI